jgi:hypothetical protein
MCVVEAALLKNKNFMQNTFPFLLYDFSGIDHIPPPPATLHFQFM